MEVWELKLPFYPSAGGLKKQTKNWQCDLPPELAADIKRKPDMRETYTIKIDLLEFFGMVVRAWVMLELRGDRLVSVRDPIAASALGHMIGSRGMIGTRHSTRCIRKQLGG